MKRRYNPFSRDFRLYYWLRYVLDSRQSHCSISSSFLFPCFRGFPTGLPSSIAKTYKQACRFLHGTRYHSGQRISEILHFLPNEHLPKFPTTSFASFFLLPSWCALRSYRPHLEVRDPIGGDDWWHSLNRRSPSWDFQGLFLNFVILIILLIF